MGILEKYFSKPPPQLAPSHQTKEIAPNRRFLGRIRPGHPTGDHDQGGTGTDRNAADPKRGSRTELTEDDAH